MPIEIFLIAIVSFMTGFSSICFFNKTINNLNSEIPRIRLSSELTVVTYPYEESFGSDGFISDEQKAEMGYKYQLFVSGVPCFEPHKMQVKTLEKS